jgi:tetratricopeptide (TPR) repeat protein
MSDLVSNAPSAIPARPAKPKTPMTPTQALAHATKLMNDGRLKQAEHVCQQIIQARPSLAEAYNILGVIKYRQGLPEEAITTIQKAIKFNGAVANFYANVGEMLRQQGEIDKAITALRRATRLDQNSAQAFNNLGIAYFDKTKFEDAVEMYRKAIAIDASYAEPHNNLGNALRALGKTQEAIEFYDKALALRPDYAEAHNNAATLLGESGRFEEAETALRRSIEVRPDNLEAYRHLANVLVHQSKTDEAIRFLNEALKRDPRSLPTLVALVRAHLKRGTYPVAEKIAKAALQLEPDNAEALCVYGQACQELDRPHEAIEIYDKALAKRPEYAECRNYLAIALKSIGDFQRAKDELNALIDKQPGMVAAYSTMADMIKYTADHPHLAAMRKLVEEAGEAKDERFMFLHYSIAKAYDDIGDLESAFRHYGAGAAIKRARLNYDEERSQAFFNGIIKTYDAAYIADGSIKGHPSTLPIFIVGMPRSGSTLVEQILSSHPEVHGAGEIKVVSQAMHEVRNVFPKLPPFPEVGSQMRQPHYDYFANHYLNVITRLSEDASHITDKLLTNYYFLGILYKAFPNAKVIHTMRNPVDTCLSCYTKLFKDDMPYTYDLRELGRYHKRYQALMAHWRAVLPDSFLLEVNYEDVVGSLEDKAKQIVAFCGLNWDAQCLKFHESDRPVKTASVAQVRKPLYSTSVDRWRRYEVQLQPLVEELGLA